MIRAIPTVALLLLALAPMTLEAQQQRPRQQNPGAQGRQGRQGPPGDRARLESEIRRGFARAVRDRVGLTNEQMRQLAPITQRYEQQRRQIQMDERAARMGLRSAMLDEANANQQDVERLLQVLIDVQKRRLQLFEAEQREMATVMTPLQRAKFIALQEQIRRRLEQMRQRAGPAGGEPPDGGPLVQPPG